METIMGILIVLVIIAIAVASLFDGRRTVVIVPDQSGGAEWGCLFTLLVAIAFLLLLAVAGVDVLATLGL